MSKGPRLGWVEDATVRLLSQNLGLCEIGNLTLHQFIIISEAVSRQEASKRSDFVTDVAIAAAGLFDSKAVNSHLELLIARAVEDFNDDTKVRPRGKNPGEG